MKHLLYYLFFFSLLIVSSLGQEVRRAISVQPAFEQEGDASLRWQCSADWFAHDPLLQKEWSDYREQRYKPMQQWAARELPFRMPVPAVVRYLFGGPDLLSVMALFPETPITILCGMEPVGKIISLEELSPEQLQEGLVNLRDTTKTFLQYGYFITKEMRVQMSSGPFQGVLPILLMFLAFTDHKILAVDMLSLGGVPGVHIRFVARSGGEEQQLFYLQANVSNEGSHAFLKWLGSFGQGAAYLKAASYLLHEDEFSHIREFLLSHSEIILQDDSGIPLRFFNQNDWTLYFFGDYKSPIELFKKNYQADLSAAYASSLLRGPMPFGTGYQLNAGESGGANLLLAVKRSFAPKATPVDLEAKTAKRN